MPRQILLSLIFLMPLRCVKLDILLNTFKNELGNWSESIPKVWKSYIRMHLFKHLKKFNEISQYINNTASIHMDNIVWKILSGTKLLLIINNSTTVTNECQHERNITYKVPPSSCVFTEKHPVRQFVSYPIGHHVMDTVVYWKLNHIFYLNLTFFVIDFSFCVTNCSLEEEYLYLIISYSYNYLLPTYKFCGQYSTFSFFSKYNTIIMWSKYYHHEIGSEY